MHGLTISLVSSNEVEQKAKEQLERLLSKYDLSDYTFTKNISIESGVIPHSHPVLTLNSFPYTDENIVLEAFIHEQLHWYLEAQDANVTQAKEELKAKYPYAPWGFPLGCNDLDSTYMHLLLCYLSYQAMQRVVGKEAADQVLYYLQNHHYIWVHKTIQADSEYLASLTNKYGLSLETN